MHATIYLDRESRTWFRYYVNAAFDAINVKPAPMTLN